jgi:hypothetical protein
VRDPDYEYDKDEDRLDSNDRANEFDEDEEDDEEDNNYVDELDDDNDEDEYSFNSEGTLLNDSFHSYPIKISVRHYDEIQELLERELNNLEIRIDNEIDHEENNNSGIDFAGSRSFL